jgi:hypothetical protein
MNGRTSADNRSGSFARSSFARSSIVMSKAPLEMRPQAGAQPQQRTDREDARIVGL